MKVFSLVGRILSWPVRMIGFGIRWCFRWLGRLWRKASVITRPIDALYECLPVRIVRKTVFVTVCVLFWFLLFVLAGGLGPTVRFVVPPVAHAFGVPLSIQKCVILPLGGYVRIEGLRVDNPKQFLEGKPDVYVDAPLVSVGLLEFDFAMRSLFTTELCVDTLQFSGLRALYAFDLGTTNVDALMAQMGLSKDEAKEVHEDVEEARETGAKGGRKDVNFRLAYVHFEDNSVSVRKFLTLPIPLPLMTLHDIDNHTLRERIHAVITPITKAIKAASDGLGSGAEVLGDGAALVGDGAKTVEDGAKAAFDGIKGMFHSTKESGK